jgi:hypothetical protein
MEAKQTALNALFLTQEELATLTTEEVDILYNTFCQEAPTYSDGELNKLCEWSDFVPYEKGTEYLNVKHLPFINLLDFALIQPTDNLLKALKLHAVFSDIKFFLYVYIRYTHRESKRLLVNSKEAKPEHLVGFDRLVDCLIKFGLTDTKVFEHFLSWALSGERQEHTYNTRDCYNYLEPELSAVKKLVPAHFTKATALQEYHDFQNYTRSYNGFTENYHDYEKNADILAYLESL